MTKVVVTDTNLTNIANAIRTKGGTSALIKPSEMATAITNLPSGGDYNAKLEAPSTYNAQAGIRGYLKEFDLIDTSSATSFQNMFNYCHNLKTIPLLNTSNVTSMYQTFGQCYNLIKIPLLDTKKVTSFDYMFQQCSILTTIPVFDTTSATSMRNMFNGCGLLTDESLDNVLQMCINATKYKSTKKYKFSLG